MRRAFRTFLTAAFYLSAGAVALGLFALGLWLFNSAYTPPPLQDPGHRVGAP